MYLQITTTSGHGLLDPRHLQGCSCLLAKMLPLYWLWVLVSLRLPRTVLKSSDLYCSQRLAC